ncbi:MerR family transcriptional regulator [Pseudoxanthomonas mexicana]
MSAPLTIGEAAKATDVRPETIRYYEKIGLLPAPPRSSGNYRGYWPDDITRLGFVRRARELGFSIEQIRELMGLAEQHDHDCCTVDELTREHVVAIERKMADLAKLRDELGSLLSACQGGRVAECRILEALAPGSERRPG